MLHARCPRNYFSYQFVDAKKSWVVQKTQIQVKLPCLTPFRRLSHTPRSRPESLSDQNHYLKAETLSCCSSVLNLLCIWSNSPFFFSSWLCITDRLGDKQRPGQQEEGTRWDWLPKQSRGSCWSRSLRSSQIHRSLSWGAKQVLPSPIPWGSERWPFPQSGAALLDLRVIPVHALPCSFLPVPGLWLPLSLGKKKVLSYWDPGPSWEWFWLNLLQWNMRSPDCQREVALQQAAQIPASGTPNQRTVRTVPEDCGWGT